MPSILPEISLGVIGQETTPCPITPVFAINVLHLPKVPFYMGRGTSLWGETSRLSLMLLEYNQIGICLACWLEPTAANSGILLGGCI